MNEWMQVGSVAKSQGINGEIKLELNSDDSEKFIKNKEIKIEDTLFTVEKVKTLVNGVFVKLQGINDRTRADSLRGKLVYVSKVCQSKLPKGRYYIVDLVGCKIIVNNVVRGVLAEVMQNGSADVYVVEGTDNHNSFMFPALKQVLRKIDIDNKIIELDAERLQEIAVYED